MTTAVKWVDGRAFAEFTRWECFNHGMYRPMAAQGMVAASFYLLRDSSAFSSACERVIHGWPITTAVHLSNLARNHEAFLGAAASCLVAGSTEAATREAWRLIPSRLQEEANRVASEATATWRAIHLLPAHSRRRNDQLVFPFYVPQGNGSPLRSIDAPAST
jgi:hypothetical protein